MYHSIPQRVIMFKQFSRKLSTSTLSRSMKESYRFVVAGGGAGGLSIASFLSRKFPKQVAVIEPNDVS